MEIQYSELENGITLLALSGKLDVVGVGAIETKFSAFCSGENTRVIVDLSSVEYIASIGIRMFTVTAKSLATRNGKMALLNPRPEVFDVLEVTGVPSIIPIYQQIESAESVLLAS